MNYSNIGLFSYLLIILLAFSCAQEEVKENKEEKKELTPVEKLNQLIEKNPDDAEAFYERAQIYYDAESYRLAETDISKAIRLDSSKHMYQHLKADIILDNLESRRALEYMEGVGRRFPNKKITQLKLAEYQLILKQYLESIATLNQLINKNPGFAEAFYMRGIVYEDMKDFRNAAKSYRRATELDAEHAEAWMKLGDLLKREKNPLALQMYNNAQRVAPRSVDAAMKTADYYHVAGKLNRASEEYRRLMEKFPQQYALHFNRGLLLLEMDSIAQAEEAFDQAVRTGPSQPAAYYYRGFAKQINGNISGAKNDFQQALNLDPYYKNAQEALDYLNENMIEQ